MSFEIRARNWWKDNPEWPNGLEPDSTPWRKAHKLATVNTEEAARTFCKEWNETHKPGRLSRKAEWSEL